MTSSNTSLDDFFMAYKAVKVADLFQNVFVLSTILTDECAHAHTDKPTIAVGNVLHCRLMITTAIDGDT